MLIGIILISIISYKYIELPFKKINYYFSKVFLLYQLLPSIIIVCVSLFVIKLYGVPSRFNNEIYLETSYLSDKYCNRKMKLDNCTFGDINQNPTRVILFGDSQAGSLTPFWDSIASKYNFSIKIITVDACYPLLNTTNMLPSSDHSLGSPILCANQINYISKNYNNFDVFILSGAFNRYINGSGKPQKFIFLNELNNTLKFLTEHGKKVIIMGNIPIDTSDSISLLIRHQIISNDNQVLKNKINMKSESELSNKIWKVSQQYQNIHYFDTATDIFSHIDTLPYYNGFLIYKDSKHLNQRGSELMAQYYLSQPQSIKLKQQLKMWGIIAK